ncbi:MAG: hemerythrin domain-containing protein [Deltaproteobacteria bacterium]|nr:hemerythrin domain-containing protein [Deltaproteobacteria bacterium]
MIAIIRIGAGNIKHLQEIFAVQATDLLKKDHEAVKKLFSEFEKLGDTSHKQRSSLAEQICEELRTHSAIEEEIFYPAVKSVRDKEAKFDVEEALQEHKQIKAAIEDIMKINGAEPAFGAKMKVLKEDVLHHAEEEEKEIFKEARKLGSGRLEELGEELQGKKERLKAAA